jgi:putative RNA 2'-phosphotransferase
MDDQQRIRTSVFLSKHLRHQPDRIGLVLDRAGWVTVEALIAACNAHGVALTDKTLREIVETNNKQRFSFDETGTLIRANQGHSVDIDLGLMPVSPPPTLYHGTARRTVSVIEREGLKKRRRQHVHLSPDLDTAMAVGRRHGEPVVFAVDAAEMSRAGHRFYRSANGVWLTDAVPPIYLSLLENESG